MAEISIVHTAESQDLATGIGQRLGSRPMPVSEIPFMDGELKVRLAEKPESPEVLFITRLYPNPNRSIVRALFVLHYLNSIGKRIRMFVPYMAYARQDREFLEGESVSIEAVLSQFAHFGVTDLFTVDVHSEKSLSNKSLRMHSISAIPALAEAVKGAMDTKNAIVISPDKGAAARANGLSSLLGVENFAMDKSRDRVTGEVKTADINFDVKGKDAIIVDDMVSTGGSIANASSILHSHGCRSVSAAFTHALLVGNSREKLSSSGIGRMFFTNTISNSDAAIDISGEVAKAVIGNVKEL